MVWLVFFLGPMAGNQDAPIDPYNWPIKKSEIIFLLLQPLTTKERFVRAPVNKTIETKKNSDCYISMYWSLILFSS